MIPNPESPNPLIDNEKQQGENGVYTSVYMKDPKLDFLVASWEILSNELRDIIYRLCKILVK